MGGYTTPFAVLGSCLFLSAIMTAFVLPEHAEAEVESKSGGWYFVFELFLKAYISNLFRTIFYLINIYFQDYFQFHLMLQFKCLDFRKSNSSTENSWSHAGCLQYYSYIY